MKRLAVLPLCLVLAASMAGTLGAEAWQLRYAVSKTSEKILAEAQLPGRPPANEEESAEGTSTNSEMTVVLTPSHLSISADGTEFVYDFEARVVYIVDLKNGTVRHESLYADIGFRDYEMKNRQFLGGALRAGGVADNPFDPVATETLFSIEAADPAEPELVTEETDETTVFKLDGKSCAWVRASSYAVPPDLRQAFVRFLVYGSHLHPRVLDQLEASAFFPQLLEHTSTNVGLTETVRLELQSAAPTIFDPQAARALPRGEDAGATPALAYARAILAGEDFAPPPPESYSRRSAIALEEGSYLEALLLQFERLLATGTSEPERIREIRQRGGQDEALTGFVATVQTLNQDPENALVLLDSTSDTEVGSAHVLAIFRANALVGAKKPAEAIAEFSRALSSNRYLAGVYKDLGDIFYSQYETGTAWEFWGAARKIAPDHAMLQQIENLERRLEAAYPRFF